MIAELQRLVQRSGLSQRVIAQRADLPERTLTRILRGHTDPKLATLQKIAGVLGRAVVLSMDTQESRPESSTKD